MKTIALIFFLAVSVFAQSNLSTPAVVLPKANGTAGGTLWVKSIPAWTDHANLKIGTSTDYMWATKQQDGPWAINSVGSLVLEADYLTGELRLNRNGARTWVFSDSMSTASEFWIERYAVGRSHGGSLLSLRGMDPAKPVIAVKGALDQSGYLQVWTSTVDGLSDSNVSTMDRDGKMSVQELSVGKATGSTLTVSSSNSDAVSVPSGGVSASKVFSANAYLGNIAVGTFPTFSTVIDSSRNATVNDLTILGTCTGCTSGLPVSDSTAIVFGSATSTKRMRFEVDGLTASTTRVLTVKDSDYTLAGSDIDNSFSAAQSFLGNVTVGGVSNDQGITVGGNTYRGYVTANQFNIKDYSGAGSNWGMIANATASSSDISFQDNSGNTKLHLVSVIGGVASDYAQVKGHFSPYSDDSYDLGSSGADWRNLYISGTVYGIPTFNNGATFSAAVDVNAAVNARNVYPVDAVSTRSLGSSGSPWPKAYVTDLTVSGTCTGCSSLPVSDATSLAKGSSDATKTVRFEVDGLSAGYTSVLTVPNTSLTLAGIDITNTFSAVQSFSYEGKAISVTSSYANAIEVPNGGVTTKNLVVTNVPVLVSLNIGSAISYTETIDSSRNGKFNSLYVGGYQVVDASRNATFASISSSGTNSIAGYVPTTTSISTSSPLGGGGALSGSLTLTCSTCATTDSTQTVSGSKTFSGTNYITGSMAVSSGNMYLRNYSGVPSCSGVSDGWVGIDTSNKRINICIGETLYYANLSN